MLKRFVNVAKANLNRQFIIKYNLYIVWQDAFIQDESIVDEQHHALLATINSLHYFLQQGLGLDVLMPTVKILVSYLMFHSKTEEGILRAANYPELDHYILESETALKNLKIACREAISHKDPQHLLAFLRQWWTSHIEMHSKLAAYLTDSSSSYHHID